MKLRIAKKILSKDRKKVRHSTWMRAFNRANDYWFRLWFNPWMESQGWRVTK